MADIFVSYSRRDSEFVQRLCDALHASGKEVWLDTETIADAELFPEAIRRAIEESEAFVFVITPDSVRSEYCTQEVHHAESNGKRIVPVLLERVPDDEIPPAVRDRNWIPFTDEGSFDQSVERVVAAVDTDLDYRRDHTRWLLKAIEWEREHEDKSFLLRGSELSAAEAWLAGARHDADPPPTDLQRGYLLTCRQANLRRQRGFATTGLTVGAIAVALLIFALVSRGQAVSAESTASSRALAAQSENLLGTDPETSILIAMKALQTRPTPDAMYATREALDRSTVQLALPTSPETSTCSLSTALYNPTAPQILRMGGAGVLASYRARTGHLEWQKALHGTLDCNLAVDPATDLAATGVGSDVDLLDPTNGSIVGQLAASALHTLSGAATDAQAGRPDTPVITFSADGSELAALTSTDNLDIWNVHTKSGVLFTPPLIGGATAQIDSASFTADGSDVVVGTGSGVLLVVDPRTGAVVRTVTVGGPTDYIVAASGPGTTLAVADSPVAVTPTTVSLWSSSTWTQQSSVASFGLIGVADLVFSPDGKQLAVGLADGAGGVWTVATHHELAAFLGGTSETIGVSYDASLGTVLLSGLDGSARVYRATGPGLGSVRLQSLLPADNLQWNDHSFSSVLASGTGTCDPQCMWGTWSWPSGVLTEHRVLSTNANALFAISGSRAVVATPPTTGSNWTVTVWDSSPYRVVRTFALPLPSAALVKSSFIGLSDDGRYLEVALPDFKRNGADLRTYDVQSGQVVETRFFPEPKLGCGIADSTGTSDGSELVLADLCGHAWVIRMNSSVPVLTTNAGGRESGVAMNRSGTQLAIASWDGVATVIDTRSGKRLFQLVGNSEGMTGIKFSPDGRYILTISVNGDVQTWSTSNGRLLRTQEDTYDPDGITFTPSGQVVTLDADNIVRMWDPCSSCQSPTQLLALAHKAVVSPLTTAEQQQSAQS